MSLAALPSIWPKTFNALGLGGASLASFGYFWNLAFPNELLAYLGSNIWGGVMEGNLFAVFFAVATAHVTGSLVLYASSVWLGFWTASPQAYDRNGRIAFTASPLLAASTTSQVDAAECLFAFGALLFFSCLGFAITSFVSEDLLGSSYLTVVGFVVFWVMRRISIQMLEDVEKELATFERLNSQGGLKK